MNYVNAKANRAVIILVLLIIIGIVIWNASRAGSTGSVILAAVAGVAVLLIGLLVLRRRG